MSKVILVVDDTPDLLDGLREFLEMEGFHVMTATNGREALARLVERPVDLIITDLLMPVMDGFELIKEVKAREDLKAIPIIVFSAKPQSEQDQTLALGATRFVIKPSPMESLLASVNELANA